MFASVTTDGSHGLHIQLQNHKRPRMSPHWCYSDVSHVPTLLVLFGREVLHVSLFVILQLNVKPVRNVTFDQHAL